MIAIKHCPPAEGLIATATYYIHQGKRKLGEESIQVFELPAHQGYHLQSALVLQWPLAHTQRITLELDPSWRPRATQIEFHAEGRSTRARYQIEGSQLWAALEVSGQRPLQLSCPWEEAVFDHPSALFAIALCKKSSLAPGDSAPINLVRIVLPSLEPLPLRGTWARLFDHTHSFELGNFFVQEFAVTSQSRELLHIWADEPGIPLRLERSEQGEPMRCECVRYRLFRD
jgi:hypothetical protein